SLGKYRHSLASHGNFTTSFNYISTNKQYNARGHFYSFDFLNNENGGLTDTSILYFETEEPNYDDRGRLETNFTDANNMFKGKRFYFDQNYILINRKKQVKENILAIKTKIQLDSINLELAAVKNDSVQRVNQLQEIYTENIDSILAQDSIYLVIDSKLKAVKKKKPRVNLDSLDLEKISNTSTFKLHIGNEVWYQYSHYRYKQETPNDMFGETFVEQTLDNARLNQFNASAFVGVQSATIGKLKAGVRYYNYNYYFNSQLFLDEKIIPKNIDGNAIGLKANWKTSYGKFKLEATGETFLIGDLDGSHLKVKTGLQKDSIYDFNAFIQLSSTQPNFNKLLYQSNYKNYNWYHNFENEKLQRIGAEFKLNKYGSIKASYNILDNYTYFNTEGEAAQTTNTINYLKAKLYLKYNFWKFTLANTVLYQKVDKGDGIYRVPEFLTRNSFYFSSHVFKGDPLFLQTGVTVKYFTPYKMNAYNPLISEFYLQNDVEIGGFPVVDFFVNAQIQRTRLYLKAENITASFTGRNYYSAPTYPYRDFIVRFGLVWNFFI
ncbi:MAG TPA: putative porin, partial [Flavobacteriaceae bacterium]|nr:putative porin [Flavobacteriaceae bacterium]